LLDIIPSCEGLTPRVPFPFFTPDYLALGLNAGFIRLFFKTGKLGDLIRKYESQNGVIDISVGRAPLAMDKKGISRAPLAMDKKGISDPAKK
jgi:hypothetical protein